MVVAGGRVGGVVPDAEILGGLLADHARALGRGFRLVVQLEVELAVLVQTGPHAVRLSVGRGRQGDLVVVVGGPAHREGQLAVADVQGVPELRAAMGQQDGVGLDGGETAGEGEGPSAHLRGQVGLQLRAGFEVGERGRGLGGDLRLGRVEPVAMLPDRPLMRLELRQAFGGLLGQAGDDVGVLVGHVVEFRQVRGHVVERRRLPEGFPFAAGGVEEEELPRALADGLQFLGGREVEVGVADRGGAGVGQERREIPPVDDPVPRRFRAEDRGERRQHVDVAGDTVAGRAGGDVAGPAQDARFAHTPFEVGGLVARERRRRPARGPVVGGEDHQGVLIEALLAERVHDPADRPVDLLHRVAQEPLGALPFEALRRRDGIVDHRIGQVEEERLLALGPQELHRLLRVAAGQLGLVGLGLDHLLVAVERQRRVARAALLHVVAVGQAEVVVETLAGREEFRQVAEVPLADHHGRVAPGLRQLGQGDLRGVEADAAPREKHPGHAHAGAVAAREQAGARHRADGGGVEMREAHPFLRETVQAWRAQGLVTEGPDVRVAHVIHEEDDDVRGFGADRRGCDGGEAGGPEQA